MKLHLSRTVQNLVGARAILEVEMVLDMLYRGLLRLGDGSECFANVQWLKAWSLTSSVDTVSSCAVSGSGDSGKL